MSESPGSPLVIIIISLVFFSLLDQSETHVCIIIKRRAAGCVEEPRLLKGGQC